MGGSLRRPQVEFGARVSIEEMVAAAPSVDSLNAARLRVAGAAFAQLSVTVPRLNPLALIARRGAQPSVFWAPPLEPWVACIGQAHGLSAEGAARFSSCAAQGREVLAGTRELLDGSAPEPRFYGGFAFHDQLNRAPAQGSGPDWAEFGAARFVLPRWRYWLAEEQAWLSLVLPVADWSSEKIHKEFVARLAAFAEQRAAASVEPGVERATRAQSWPSEERARADWERLVESALRKIQGGEAEKLVAARFRGYELPEAPCLTELLSHFEAAPSINRVAFRFGEAELVAATPERLVQKRGEVLFTEALAGTKPRGPAAARELMASEKERAEHQWVVSEILTRLRPFTKALHHPAEPNIRELKHLVHLLTPIQGEVLSGERHVLDLVAALHPTPAVGGVPRELALRWIAEEEAFERGWYASPVGWFNAAGDGDFWVALRSGLFQGARALLFAGAGIVAGSDAAQEYTETQNKLGALLQALKAQRGEA